jgi:hypothetical protein
VLLRTELAKKQKKSLLLSANARDTLNIALISRSRGEGSLSARAHSVDSSNTPEATSRSPDANATERRSTREAIPGGYDHGVLEEVNAPGLTPARPTTGAVIRNDLFP